MEKKFERISQFLDQIYKESDRGCALICAAILDELLTEVLQVYLIECKSTKLLFTGANGPLNSFYSKILLTRSLGVMDEAQYNDFNKIRKIRNEFAHEIGEKTFESEKIKSICMSLNIYMTFANEDGSHNFEKGRKEFYSNPRDAFNNTTLAMANWLTNTISRNREKT